LRLLALSRASFGLRKADWRWGGQVPSEEPSFFGVLRSIPPLDDPLLTFSFHFARRAFCLVHSNHPVPSNVCSRNQLFRSFLELFICFSETSETCQVNTDMETLKIFAEEMEKAWLGA
jgi:hypothetical protein